MADDPTRLKMDEIDWGTTLFLLLSPAAAIVAVVFYVLHAGFHPADGAIFAASYILCGLAITGGYHRLWAHGTYKCHAAIRVGYLGFGAAALQTPVLNWAANHRYHHQFVDHDGDPYNATRGFFFAHMGWIFHRDRPGREFSNAKDLKRDRLVMWQSRYYWPLAAIFGFGLPTLAGWAFGRPLGGFLWGGLLRVVALHHATFMINSVAHYFGSKPYTLADTSHNNRWLAFLALGEGLHNFHHAFAGDYRSSLHWYQWDPTKWWIRSLRSVGLARDLRTVPERLILQATMATALQTAGPALERLPIDRRREVDALLEDCQERFDTALAAYVEQRAAYREWLDAPDVPKGWARRREQARRARSLLVTWRTADRARRAYLKTLRRTAR